MSSPIENLEQKRAAFRNIFQANPSDNTVVMMDTARTEAASLKNIYVGTEHLLLAASSNPDTAEVLDGMGLTPKEVKKAIVFIIGEGNKPVESNKLGLTPRALSGILVGAEEATRSYSDIEPSHILLGLARMETDQSGGGGIAMGIVESKGYRPEQFADLILRANQKRTAGVGEQAGFDLAAALSDIGDIKDMLTRPGINGGVKANIAAILQTVNRTYNPKSRY